MILNFTKKILQNQKFYLYLSIISFILSYFPLLIPPQERTNLLVVFGGGLLYLAAISLAEYVTRRLGGFSQLRRIMKTPKTFLTYISVGFLGGLILDSIFQWLSRLWIYPFWTTNFYLLIFIAGFSVYYLSIISTYLISKTVIGKTRRRKKSKNRERKSYKSSFSILLVLSIMMITVGLSGLVMGFINSRYPLFDVNVAVESSVDFVFVAITFIGIWFLLESIGYRLGRKTFIIEILNCNFEPLISVLISSLLFLIIMESQNGPIQLWTYINWPLQDIKIFYTPIIAVLFWPLHYLVIITLYKVISKEQTKDFLD
jgi:hypothetical protein